MDPDLYLKAFGSQPSLKAPGAGLELESVCIVAPPDSWNFQQSHYRAMHSMLQGKHLANHDTVYLADIESASNTVNALWEKLVPNLKKSVTRLSPERQPIHADELVFSCGAPLAHPWFAQQLAEEAGVVKRQKPLAERLIVLLCPYTSDTGNARSAGERSLADDGHVVSALGTLLTIRGQNESLEIFSERQWEDDFDGMVQFFSQVRALIGLHGGVLGNLKWAPRYTAVVEVMPHDFLSLALYERASILGQTYAFMRSLPVGSASDMTVNIPELMGLVDSVLGKEQEGGVLHPSHD